MVIAMEGAMKAVLYVLMVSSEPLSIDALTQVHSLVILELFAVGVLDFLLEAIVLFSLAQGFFQTSSDTQRPLRLFVEVVGCLTIASFMNLAFPIMMVWTPAHAVHNTVNILAAVSLSSKALAFSVLRSADISSSVVAVVVSRASLVLFRYWLHSLSATFPIHL
eukprot:c11801_g1_i2.p1 GENE.c11801_g1_i2~~c11801_g1_i2.p1  ORF type:complete len:164 (-),score=34.03 c11801_g1_i2:3-494(-)